METDKINHTSKAVSHTAKDRQEGEGVVGRCPDFMGYGSCHMTVEAHFHFKGGWLFRPRQYPVPTILHPKGAHTKGPHNILSQGGPQYPVPRGSTVSGGGGGGGGTLFTFLRRLSVAVYLYQLPKLHPISTEQPSVHHEDPGLQEVGQRKPVEDLSGWRD